MTGTQGNVSDLKLVGGFHVPIIGEKKYDRPLIIVK